MLVIVFSCNRAMQLDAMLRSIREHCQQLEPDVHVVYRTDEPHAESYRILRAEQETHSHTCFHELVRYSLMQSVRAIAPYLADVANAYRVLKYQYVRRLRDDFKAQIEAILCASSQEFVMFQTDDTTYYRTAVLPPTVARAIRADPSRCSYRFYVGANIQGCPCRVPAGEHLEWDYYAPTSQGHWSYPFSVDGTVYHREWLLRFLHQFLYHMPTTLESFIVSEIRRRRLLGCGHAPRWSALVHLALNNVQTLVKNTNEGVSPELLLDRYLDGYRLHYALPDNITTTPLRKPRIVLRRADEDISLP